MQDILNAKAMFINASQTNDYEQCYYYMDAIHLLQTKFLTVSQELAKLECKLTMRLPLDSLLTVFYRYTRSN